MKRTEPTVPILKAAALVLLFLGGPIDPATAAERELRGGVGAQANPLGLRAESKPAGSGPYSTPRIPWSKALMWR